MGKQQRRVTSVDVARASGVSRATVGYVFNNDPRQSISAETRERVLAAARALGYQPSPAARVLRAGYSHLVLAVLPFEQIDPGMARVLKALGDELAKCGYSLISYIGRGAAEGTAHPAANLTPAVVVNYLDGSEPEDEGFLHQFNAPILTMENTAGREAVGLMQVAYLHQRGWRRMVFVAPERGDIQQLAEARLAGVRQGCAAHQLEAPQVLRVAQSRAAAHETIQRALAQPGGAPAFCCYNDEIAFVALAALADSGVAVPQAAAVIGCDDIPLAPFSTPALTTIGFHEGVFHEHLVKQILATIAGETIAPLPAWQATVMRRASA